jgi:signal transduction histidine kinase
MDPVSSENLRSFLEYIKDAKLPEDTVSWRKIQSQSETAIGEYEQLTSCIRELVRLKEELRLAVETHEKEVQRLNLFASITRHEVLNNIVALEGYLEIMESRVSDPATAQMISMQREIARKIHHQIDISRSYRDIGVSRPVWQNVNECIGKTISDSRHHGISVALNCPTDLEILADHLLVRVFDNLLDNSLRHGERVKDILVSSYHDGDGLIIAWEDDGVGIDADRKEKIFDRGQARFFLSLFLTREVLNITGITIHETGTYGKGARFEMRVPEGAYRFTARNDSGSG